MGVLCVFFFEILGHLGCDAVSDFFCLTVFGFSDFARILFARFSKGTQACPAVLHAVRLGHADFGAAARCSCRHHGCVVCVFF